MQDIKKASIVLDDGTVFHGKSFGYEASVSGEVVFSTAMTGYPESLTDPSYSGQILVSTYPMIGNYGVPRRAEKDGLSESYESEKIHVSGMVVCDYSYKYSHRTAVKSLADWLKEEHVAGIYGIDTRQLTKILRERGSMLGKIIIDGCGDVEMNDPNKRNLVEDVSCREVITYGNGGKKVVLVDCGVKHNIIRCLLKRGVTVVRVPWNYDFNTLDYDGLFLSNGPGDPDFCAVTVENIRKALGGDKPVFGICLGNQLLAKAGGAKTFKLKYGHRSHNQPVRQVGTDRCIITSQNHGFAVDNNTLGSDWEPLFINMNDGTNEGIRHKSKPYFSAQFHPEADGGPTDAEYLFDDFIKLL
ncbi:MAG TPA: glutamine-hydrolyzing carbamoyl-phosphate synthase small subunit [Candidatus Avibacteroides excrementipullorum]|jgi:carbamoyl-phosphate synthase small subunit|nr:glutamine-hydrolyzing carbamoyl-phosphate synthase small subunit [Candidatus Avibacteroides excrementipullorum]